MGECPTFGRLGSNKSDDQSWFDRVGVADADELNGGQDQIGGHSPEVQ